MTVMNVTASSPLPRQLYLTPYVKWFLEKCGKTQSALELSEDIWRAVSGRDRKDGCIRLSAPTFLLFILDPKVPGGPERVIVWHGPSDGGASLNPAIIEKAIPCHFDCV